MRNLAATFATPAAGYVGAVLGVMAIAYLAVFNLQGMAAKAHRHWDADIDRIIAKQQEKKRDMDIAALARTDMTDIDVEDRPQIATLTTGSIADDSEPMLSDEDTAQQKAQTTKKSGKRIDRKRQHFIPTAFATLPKFAATAASTTTTLLKLR